jgi:hypothetical protein
MVTAVLQPESEFVFAEVSGAGVVRKLDGLHLDLIAASNGLTTLTLKGVAYVPREVGTAATSVVLIGDKGTRHELQLPAGGAPPTIVILPMCSDPACPRAIPVEASLPLGACELCAAAGRMGIVFRVPEK